MVYAGFDIVPRLSRDGKDKQDWEKFLNIVQEVYEDDPRVEVKANWIEFNVGEYALLPLEGHRFLRFSANIADSTANSTGTGKYIAIVGRIAKMVFGPRIHDWHEVSDGFGYYGWDIVNDNATEMYREVS